jgi:hypothetical protein
VRRRQSPRVGGGGLAPPRARDEARWHGTASTRASASMRARSMASVVVRARAPRGESGADSSTNLPGDRAAATRRAGDGRRSAEVEMTVRWLPPHGRSGRDARNGVKRSAKRDGGGGGARSGGEWPEVSTRAPHPARPAPQHAPSAFFAFFFFFLAANMASTFCVRAKGEGRKRVREIGRGRRLVLCDAAALAGTHLVVHDRRGSLLGRRHGGRVLGGRARAGEGESGGDCENRRGRDSHNTLLHSSASE